MPAAAKSAVSPTAAKRCDTAKPRRQPCATKKFAALPSASTGENKSTLPSPSKSTAKRRALLGKNCGIPNAPAKEPRKASGSIPFSRA